MSSKLLDAYEIGRELGRGGFSIVYLATEKATGKQVAIKMIEKDVDVDSAEIASEFKIQRQFDCPYIVNIYDFCEEPTRFILVMEYVNGGELFDAIVNDGPYSEHDAAALVQQILIGLKVLHDNNIVHRDLKPENLILQKNDDGTTTCKISDFGLAGIFTLERMRRYCGTEGYAAPEIMRNVPYDESVDVWSLGVIVYVLLCAFRPFESEDPVELYQLVTNGELEFPSPEWDDVSLLARDFIDKMLQRTPEKRIKIDEALEHPWIQGNAPKVKLGDLHQHLKKFNVKRKLKRVTEVAKAAERLKRIAALEVE